MLYLFVCQGFIYFYMNALAFLSIFYFFCFNLFIWNNICKLIERTIQVSMSGNPEKYIIIVIFFNVMEINKCYF